jgi:hypothetical protein
MRSYPRQTLFFFAAILVNLAVSKSLSFDLERVNTGHPHLKTMLSKEEVGIGAHQGTHYY